MNEIKILKELVQNSLEQKCGLIPINTDIGGGKYYSYMVDIDPGSSLDNETIERLVESPDPIETLYDEVSYLIIDSYSEILDIIGSDIISGLKSDFPDIHGGIMDILQDIVSVDINYEYFLKQPVLVNIIMNTGDLNHDFNLTTIYPHYDSCEDDIIDEHCPLVWLACQQGYSKDQLQKALLNQDNCGESKFLQSIRQEVENCNSSMNALAFFVAIPLGDYIKLFREVSAMNSDGLQSNPWQREIGDCIELGEKTPCGLYDTWSGAGSLLEIKLNSDIKVPLKYIWRVEIDGTHCYGIKDIYGLGKSFWKETLKGNIISRTN